MTDAKRPPSTGQIRFMIVAQARSGSSYLRESLNRQPDIICHGEVLSRAWIGKLVAPPDRRAYTRAEVSALLPVRQADPLGFLDRHVFAFDVGATGFKIVYEDLLHDGLAPRLAAYATLHDVRVIHLRRQNHLATHVSRLRMASQGISHSDSRTSRKANAERTLLHVDPVRLKQFIRRQGRYAAMTDEMFPQAFQARYETLPESFGKMLAFLGLPSGRDFNSHLEKLAPTSLADIVENYPEIAAFDTPPQPVWS